MSINSAVYILLDNPENVNGDAIYLLLLYFRFGII